MRQLTNYEPKSVISPDGLRIYYEICRPERTNGKYVLFAHGLGGDLTAWDQERIAFDNLGYVTLALDLRGHGLSQRGTTEESYEIDKFVQDILTIIKQEHLPNVSIVGHCYGGLVALTLEALYPKTAEALILVDTTYKPAGTNKLAADHTLLSKIFTMIGGHVPGGNINGHVDPSRFVGGNDIDLSRFLSDIMHTSLKSYFLIYHKFLSIDATTLLSRIVVPTLIVEGENDSVFPPTVAEVLYENIKGSELVVIKHANHIIVINNPEELVTTMHRFLQKT